MKRTTMDARMRLGKQLLDARKRRNYRIGDVARRTGKNPARISELENGKANSTIDFLEEMGAALGMTLLFIPDEKVANVEALIEPVERHVTPAYSVPSVFDEVFIDDSEDDEAPTHAYR
jgi:transcriptional regulator with XRE-family HTH domain